MTAPQRSRNSSSARNSTGRPAARTSSRITPKGTRPAGAVARGRTDRADQPDVVHDHSWTRNDHQRPGRSSATRDMARRSGHRGGR